MRGSRHRARYSHADRAAPAKLPLDLLYAFLYRSHGCFVITSRRRYSVSVQFASIALEGHELDLCASQIDSNANLVVLRIPDWTCHGIPKTYPCFAVALFCITPTPDHGRRSHGGALPSGSFASNRRKKGGLPKRVATRSNPWA